MHRNRKKTNKPRYSFRTPFIFVVSDRFPSINQAWIDTYLEQLLKHSFDFTIYSANKSPQIYHEKVDRLSLRQHLLDFDLKKSSLFLSLVKDALLHPWQFFRSAVKAWKITSSIAGKYNLNSASMFFRLIRFRDTEGLFGGIDLIHSHAEILAYEFMFLALMSDLPLIHTFHGFTPKGVPPLADNKRKAFYDNVSRVLVNTRFAMRQVVSVGCPSEKVIIVPQGLPLDEFPFSPLPCPSSGDVLHLLSVGRFYRDKGYGYSLLAVARLIKAGVNIHFHIVGEGPDKQWMQNLIVKLDISEQVTLYNAMPSYKLTKMYDQAHIFILASLAGQGKEWTETQGVVLQEAQAKGCIPIATRVGGIPECLNHEQNAILVPEKSSKAIANSILYLLQRPEEWKWYQENGRRNVEENFSADVIGKRIAEILSEVAQSWEKREVAGS